jgi:hypothetical protein
MGSKKIAAPAAAKRTQNRSIEKTASIAALQ